MGLKAIILAAGKGTRMKSSMPKVLHSIAGKPMLAHVQDTIAELSPEATITVIGHGAEQVQSALEGRSLWAIQDQQLGTAHAVLQGLPQVGDDDTVLIAYGDVPFTQLETFSSLVDLVSEQSMALLTDYIDDPSGYGRILRNAEGDVVGVVEQKDASPEQLQIKEWNTGIMAARGVHLKSLLEKIGNDNAQGEYYLPDVFALAVAEGIEIRTTQPAFDWETAGVNSRNQLAALERDYQYAQAQRLLADGVMIRDPARFDLRGKLSVGRDCEFDINVVIEGRVEIGDNVYIGPGCVIKDSRIADNVRIEAHSVVDGATIGEGCSVGPFARLRPDAELMTGARIGNFVEVKKSRIGEQSKVNHLSYVGDAEVGRDVNIGAGTITVNYDGANKHPTVIGDTASIGSNTSLIAPITVESGATVGAGSVLSKDVKADTLTFNRAPVRVVSGWRRPKKKSKA